MYIYKYIYNISTRATVINTWWQKQNMANKEIKKKKKNYQIKPHETHIVYICVNMYKYVRVYVFIYWYGYIRFCRVDLCRDGRSNINNLLYSPILHMQNI